LIAGLKKKTESSLTVSAAISLKDSFEEIGRLFQKKHKGVKVFFNFVLRELFRPR
jgi:ABC-type molybdate transport system substrate-binding protein